jgi:hypothetical protein
MNNMRRMREMEVKVWKHKNGIVEIVYKNRIETYKLSSTYLPSDYENDTGDKPNDMAVICDDDYYRSNGFKRVRDAE